MPLKPSLLLLLLFFCTTTLFGQEREMPAYKKEALGFRTQSVRASSIDSALIYGREFLNVALKHKDDSLVLNAYSNLSVFHFQASGGSDSTIKYLEISEKWAKKLEDNKYLIKTYEILGAVYSMRSDLDKGIENFDKALKIAEKEKDSMRMAALYSNIGNAYVDLDVANSREFFMKSLEMYQLLKVDEQELVVIYRNLSESYSDDEKKQREYVKLAIDIAERNEMKYEMADIYMVKGTQLYGKPEEQVVWYEKSLKISREIGFTANIQAVLLYLIGIKEELEEYQDALDYLEEFDAEFDYKTFDPENRKFYLDLSARVCAKTGRFEQAFLHAREFGKISDSLQDLEISDRFAEYNKKFALEQKNAKIARQELEIANESRNRNRIIFGAIIAFLLAVGVYQWYIFRQRRRKESAEMALKKEQEFNEVRTNFLENIAHEIRTPLTMINGYLNIALEEKNNQKSIEKALESSQKVFSNANEILDLLKFEKGMLELNPSRVRLNGFVKRVFFSFESLAGVKGVELSFQTNVSNDLYGDIDEGRVEKILNNLISNAIKYSSAKQCVSMIAELSDRELTIEVRDQGPGIHFDEHSRIFDRFYQSKKHPNIGGVGVGLSLARDFAQSMGGTLTVKSEEGKGSSFFLTLPIEVIELADELETVEAASTIKEPSEIDVEFLKEERPRLLVVEDNLEMSEFLQGILGEEYQCKVAFDGIEALQLVQRESFDLIISDVMMPQMGGFELREKILTIDKVQSTPFIFLTAKALMEDKLRGFDLGVDDYITKPFDRVELLSRIRVLLENKSERESRLKDHLEFMEGSEGNAEEVLIQKIRKNIIERISDADFKVAQLAEEVGYSQRQLSRIVQKHIGLTPVQYMLEIRLQKAYRSLMEKEFMTVSELRYSIGIESASYFNRKFKERFGILPSQLLKEE